MKQVITLLALIFGYMLCGAQATSLTVDNQTPGWLSSKINYGDQQSVRDLTVTGYINQTDLNFIGNLMSKYNLSGHLNLTNAEVVDTEFKISPTTGGGSLSMFNLNKTVSLERFSIPKSIPYISPYLLAGVKADSLDYGSERCQILTKFLVTNRYFSTNRCPKVLILREGMTKIQAFGTDEGNEKKLQTILFPQTIDSIGNNAFKGCTNLGNINLPNAIYSLGEGAFAETSIYPDTLYLPTSLKIYYTNSFPIKDGQTIVLGSEIINFNNESWCLKQTANVTFLINKVTPPTFTKGASGNFYSDGKELSGCTLYVPKEGYSMYADPEYNSVGGPGGFWSGWSNPYSHAKLKTIHIPVESISLNYSSTNLNVGNNVNLVATVLPENADNKSISWVSSNPNIASVNSGLVTAISPGNVIIYAISNENSNIIGTCEVSVHQPLQAIALNPKNISLTASQTFDGYSLTFYPTNADNKKVIWQSSDTDVVTIDSTGKISAIKGGEAKILVISIENSNIKDEGTVTVIQPVTGISINKSSIELTEDDSEQLFASVLPENASNKSVNWTSSDVSIAMVSPDGTVYGIKAGQATIMATTVDGGFVALCKVTVKAKTVLASNIVLSANSEIIAVGETLQLNATISPDNTTNKTINWTSTNTQVASVSALGLVTALSEGSTQIIASSVDGSNLSAICDLTVENQFVKITQIKISPSNARIAVGNSLTLSALVSPDNATNPAIAWSSTNPSVATVSDDGKVTAVEDGEAVIIASTLDGSNLSATCPISVYTETILVESIILNPSKIEGDVNEAYGIIATVLPENASEKIIRWRSSDDEIATVEDGIVKLKALGTAIITAEATDGSHVKAECAVVVSHGAGIDEIISDKNTFVKIFNLNGYLIYDGIYADAHLTSGYYIILCNGSSIKTRIN